METSINKTIEIMKTLRSENGCPWDRVQTINTIKAQLLEESYEVIEAIEYKDLDNLKEELGDLFLSIVHISEIMSEQGIFTLGDVIESLNEKLIRRHPHVFSDIKVNSEIDAKKTWDEVKKSEGKRKREKINREFSESPLLKVQNLVRKSGNINTDIEKFEKNIKILENEKTLEMTEKSALITELLLEIVKISEKNGLIADFALTNAIDSFINRFEGK